MKRAKQLFHFQPFSKKQRKILNWWCPESPVRIMTESLQTAQSDRGKTVSMSLSFTIWAMDTFNGQNFAMWQDDPVHSDETFCFG